MFHFRKKELFIPFYRRYSSNFQNSLLKTLYSKDLRKMGVKKVGEGISVDPTVRIINPSKLEIGSNTRIDAFAVLSAGNGGISIGDYVHIGSHAFMAGSGHIRIGDFTGLSGRVSIYSSNDDYSGEYLTGPTIPVKFRNITTGAVIIGRHTIIGAGSIILPNITIGNGVAAGALSFINKDVQNFKIVAGCPIKVISERSQTLLELETEFIKNLSE